MRDEGGFLKQQLLNAGLVDQLEVGIMPVFLGAGLRFFEQMADVPLEKVRVVENGPRTDLIFRVVK